VTVKKRCMCDSRTLEMISTKTTFPMRSWILFGEFLE
jgi:hypothetical protein